MTDLGTLMLRSDHDAVVDRLAQQLRLVTEDRDLMATTVERVRVAVDLHPAPCPETPSCGWRDAVSDVRAALQQTGETR